VAEAVADLAAIRVTQAKDPMIAAARRDALARN
jgi:hypothetical protein